MAYIYSVKYIIFVQWTLSYEKFAYNKQQLFSEILPQVNMVKCTRLQYMY